MNRRQRHELKCLLLGWLVFGIPLVTIIVLLGMGYR